MCALGTPAVDGIVADGKGREVRRDEIGGRVESKAPPFLLCETWGCLPPQRTLRYSNGESWTNSCVSHICKSLVRCCAPHSLTRARALGGKSSFNMSRVQISIAPTYFPYMAWKWGGVCPFR